MSDRSWKLSALEPENCLPREGSNKDGLHLRDFLYTRLLLTSVLFENRVLAGGTIMLGVLYFYHNIAPFLL